MLFLFRDLLATGCNDAIVRIWNTNAANAKPEHLLHGHKAKVFHVRWHPLLKNILCSGSDDKYEPDLLFLLNGVGANCRCHYEHALSSAWSLILDEC